ncbi:MAG: Ig-like domain-containing protein [Bacteroidales bacterium]|nr:Ig-like domain-containing protein [Bacteroidales bacterium]
MRRFFLILTACLFGALACTDFEQEVAPAVFEIVGDGAIGFSETGGSGSILLKSGSKWDVKTPEWVHVTNIQVTSNPFEWRINITCDANDTYDIRREDILFTTDGRSKSVTVSQDGKPVIHVTSVTLNAQQLELEWQSQYQLNATVSPSDATYKTITWTSSDPSAVSVDENGLVTALSNNSSAKITAKADGKSAVCSVNVTAKLKGIEIVPDALELVEDQTANLQVVYTPDYATNKTVTWKTSNSNIVSVTTSGKVTARKAGSATITATSQDGGFPAKCSIKVIAKVVNVTGVSVYPASLSMVKGDKEKLLAVVEPTNATDPTVTWDTTNPDVVTVSSDGYVTAVGGGEAQVVATTNDGGFIASCNVTVTVPVTAIALNRYDLQLKKGDIDYLTVSFEPTDATDQTVTWASSAPTIVSVTSKGKVTALNGGEAIITATSNDGGHQASCVVTVEIPLVSIAVTPSSCELETGDSKQLQVSFTPSTATNQKVNWSSNNTYVATVDSKGLVTAVGAGGATIYAQSDEDFGIWSSCYVTVKDKYIKVKSVNISPSVVDATVGLLAYFDAWVEPANATNPNLIVSSADESIATVQLMDGRYAVLGQERGTTYITVQSEDSPELKAVVTVNASHKVPEAVDMGLGVKWASWNVGTWKAENYGNYYAWGETKTKSVFIWDDYALANGSLYSITKYNDSSTYGIVDNKEILEPVDDVAAVAYGDGWHMPTEYDFAELLNTARCEWTWTTQNAVNGYRVYSYVTGNSIFLPAAGYKTSSSYNTGGGRYWSSNVNNSFNAKNLGFSSSGRWMSYGHRAYGFSVRAVYGTSYVPVSGIQLDQHQLTLGEDGTYQLSATVSPDSATNKNVKWSSSNTAVAKVSNSGLVTAMSEGDATITAETEDGGYKDYCNVKVTAALTAVNLGLPSGTKWANMNLNASRPADTGDYFAWGETQGKSSFNWATYALCNGSYASLTKYNNNAPYGYGSYTDNLTMLEPEDDAAQVLLGGDWRIPTEDEVLELRENCTWTETTQTDSNGKSVSGYLVTSNINGKSIFLPQCGYKMSGAGAYSTTSLYLLRTAISSVYDPTNRPYRVRTLVVSYSSAMIEENMNIERCWGMPIRAVVGKPTVRVSSISVSLDPRAVGVGESITISPKVYPSNATNKKIIWRSSDRDCATVEGGVVTGRKAGDCTITATTEDGGYSVSVDVTVMDNYSKFLGTWRVLNSEGVYEEWNISQYVNGSSYTITGINGITDVPVRANYSSSTQTLSVNVQESLSSFTYAGYNFKVSLLGIYEDFNNDLCAVTGNYPIFTAKMSGLNTFEMTPGAVTVIPDGYSNYYTFQLTYFCLAAIRTSDGALYAAGNGLVPLPATATRTTSYSAPAKGQRSVKPSRMINHSTINEGD